MPDDGLQRDRLEPSSPFFRQEHPDVFGSSAQSHSKIRILKGGNFSNGVPGIQLVCNPDRCVSGREIPCQLSLRMELIVRTSQNATILVDNYSNIFEEDLRFV